MSLSRIFQLLVPKDNKFMNLFEEDAENLVKTAMLLKILVSTDNVEQRNSYVIQIKEHEDMGDEITHTIFDELNKTFITPFDRDDIHELTASIDDVVDHINSSCQKIKLYNLKTITSEFVQMAEYIYQASKEIETAIKAMKNMKNPKEVHAACIHINSIENLGDDEYHTALNKLFERETDAIELIKKKEILQSMERAIDCAENVSDIIKTILIKNA